MRRLYDSRHQLIAGAWQTKNGERGSWQAKPEPAISAADRQLIANSLWTQDLSSLAFRSTAEPSVHLTTTAEGYELASPIRDDTRPQLLSATLVVNRSSEVQSRGNLDPSRAAGFVQRADRAEALVQHDRRSRRTYHGALL